MTLREELVHLFEDDEVLGSKKSALRGRVNLKVKDNMSVPFIQVRYDSFDGEDGSLSVVVELYSGVTTQDNPDKYLDEFLARILDIITYDSKKGIVTSGGAFRERTIKRGGKAYDGFDLTVESTDRAI